MAHDQSHRLTAGGTKKIRENCSILYTWLPWAKTDSTDAPSTSASESLLLMQRSKYVLISSNLVDQIHALRLYIEDNEHTSTVHLHTRYD
jgi:hypothetical protein